jgi:hypothetical protein
MIGGFEPERFMKKSKAQALLEILRRRMRREARRRHGSVRQDVERWKANPPSPIN